MMLFSSSYKGGHWDLNRINLGCLRSYRQEMALARFETTKRDLRAHVQNIARYHLSGTILLPPHTLRTDRILERTKIQGS